MPDSRVQRLAQGLPFFYGWVILGCVVCACLSRAGPAVATLSIFIAPMTTEFGWTRTEISGAVSLGGVLAAIASPMIGSYLDRKGPRVVLGLAVLATGITLMALSGIQSLLGFYLLYCVARMNWAGPYDLGIHGALNNWFIRQRAWAASLAQLAQTIGLIIMPFIGYAMMERYGWRTAWLVIGACVLAIGFLPGWLLIVRRPEDIGLVPDGADPALGKNGADPAPNKNGADPAPSKNSADPAPGKNSAVAPSLTDTGTADGTSKPPIPEPSYTREEALKTRAFWTLALFTSMIYPVQAGMSLHQAAHMVEIGLTPANAATAVSLFTATSAITGFSYGLLGRWVSVKMALAAGGVILAASAFVMMRATTFSEALLAGALFGAGIGGVHFILPVAWADYFGRKSFGAIRGVALSIQVGAQAAGPLMSGILRDYTGNYTASLMLFGTLSLLGALAALLTRAPVRG